MEKQEKIIWNDNYSIGNSDIDAVHKNLIDIYNDLVEYVQDERNREDFAVILSKMTEYCLMHFKKEEEYMKKFSYPDFAVHKKNHKDYIYKVAMYNVDLLSANPPSTDEIIHFLENWWVNHILDTDKKYEEYKSEIRSDAKY